METLPYMKAAQKLYRKVGFDYIDGPWGTPAIPVVMFGLLNPFMTLLEARNLFRTQLASFMYKLKLMLSLRVYCALL